jgi:hypothetical protein
VKGEGFPALWIIFFSNYSDMSRLMLNQSRMFMRQAPSLTRRAMFSTGLQRLQEQQTGKNITHFGFRDVAEEEKESLGRIYMPPKAFINMD